MNKEQKASVIRMRSKGMTFSEIANHINKMMNEKKAILSKNEEIIINGEIKKVENELENWYNI